LLLLKSIVAGAVSLVAGLIRSPGFDLSMAAIRDGLPYAVGITSGNPHATGKTPVNTPLIHGGMAREGCRMRRDFGVQLWRTLTGLVTTLLVVVPPVSVVAEPVTVQRIHELAPDLQAEWQSYLDRSKAAMKADHAALQAELIAGGMTEALRAPSGGDFKLPAEPGDAWYGSEEAGLLADVIVSYQSPSGGWSKHTGYSKGPRQRGMQFTSQSEPGQRPHYLATFDNRATTEEMTFLAAVWQATQREDCRLAFVKGLDFIVAAQFPNGGWPQVYPLEGKYHDDITFNDDAMTRILELLQDIENGEPCYAFLSDSQRKQAAGALGAGLVCVLQTQIVLAGTRTGWSAQHDALTLQPTPARAMEPATLSGLESARLLKYLMTIPNPSPELVASIEAGLDWLERVKITGLSKSSVNGETAYVAESGSTETYWARFYSLTSGRPVFPGRDGVIYDTFEAMAANNRLGYDFYSTLPGSIVNNGQKKWRKMLAGRSPK